MLSNLHDIPGTERSNMERAHRQTGPEKPYPGFLSTTVIRNGDTVANMLRRRTDWHTTRNGRSLIRAVATQAVVETMIANDIHPAGSVPVSQFGEDLALVYLSTKRTDQREPTTHITYLPKRSPLSEPRQPNPSASDILRQSGLTAHLLDVYTPRRRRKLPATIIATALTKAGYENNDARSAACDPNSMIMFTTDERGVVSGAIARWRSPIIYSGTGKSSALRMRELGYGFGPTQEIIDATMARLKGHIVSDISRGVAPLDAFCQVSGTHTLRQTHSYGWQIANWGMEPAAPALITAIAA